VDAHFVSYRAGILVAIDTPAMPSITLGFTRESQHIKMLNDHSRTSAFINALNASVTPGDVVVDIGTSTGVLAMAAARAGAAHVYAIEESAIAESAQAVFDANGLSDRITLIRGRSTQVSLPQRASLVVAEILGDDLFDEQILPTLADAAGRLATPDARFIPMSVQPVLVPLHFSEEFLNTERYSATHIARWRQDYGFDFGALLNSRFRAPGLHKDMSGRLVRDTQCADSIPMPPVLLGDHPRFYDESIFWPGFAGANAVAVAFTSELGAGFGISTDPTAAMDTHWGVLVWMPITGDLSGPGELQVTSTRTRTQVTFSAQTSAH
jgi:hypothetical protein